MVVKRDDLGLNIELIKEKTKSVYTYEIRKDGKTCHYNFEKPFDSLEEVYKDANRVIEAWVEGFSGKYSKDDFVVVIRESVKSIRPLAYKIVKR